MLKWRKFEIFNIKLGVLKMVIGVLCLISDSTTITTTTTTITVEPTSTPTKSELSATIKPGHIIYWFYHAFTNKCLYAPQKNQIIQSQLKLMKILIIPCE